MNESIHRYFKVGIVSFMAYPSTLRGEAEDTVAVLKKTATDDYFDAIEVNWIKDAKQRKQAAAMLKSAHLTVCYGAQPRLLTTGLNPNDLAEQERARAESTLIEGIDEAQELGAVGIAFLAGRYEEATKEQAYEQLLKTTKSLCSHAAERGMMVELEVFDYDIAKKSLIGPAALAARFAADVRAQHSNFGLLVDLSHIPMCHESCAEVIDLLKPYITHLHIGNTVCSDSTAEGYGDEHQRFGFPNSENDVEQVLEFLQVLQHAGLMNAEKPLVLSFEVKPWKDEDEDVVVANAKRTLNRAWALL